MPDDLQSAPDQEYEGRVLGWCKEAVEESDGFLKAQFGYNLIAKTIDAIMGENREIRSPTLSNVSDNHMGMIATNIAAMMTDVKPAWEYRTQNRKFDQNTVIAGKLSLHWYLQRQIDMKFCDVVKYWLFGGTGVAHVFYNETTQDLDLSGEDPRDVLPIRPGSNLSFQNAFGVISRRERTVNYLRRRYPSKAHLIIADRDGSAASSTQNTRFGKLMEMMVGSPFKDRLFDSKPARDIPRIPTCDVYTIYIDDRKRNRQSFPVGIGQFGEDKNDPETYGKPLNNWSYMVQPGDLLYPNKRCIICTNTAILYDGPSIYWHGMFPFVKLTLDPWPQSWLGKSPMWDLLPMQKMLDNAWRVVDDHNAKVARPDLLADKNSVSESAMKKWDTRRPGGKYRSNQMGGKGMQIQYPMPLDATIFKTIESMQQEMEQVSGSRDLSQMMRLQQLPSAETMDKLMFSMSPAIRFRSRVMESFMRELATMMVWNFSQWYTMPMRLLMLGPQGVTKEDFDFDPGSMIPDYIHGDDFDNRGIPTAEALARGPLPRYERANEFLKQFTYHVAPGSLLSSSEIDEQLKYLQLARAGWLDHWTLLEKLHVPNVGEPPEGANNVTQRLLAEQALGLQGTASPAGRKASGQAPPRMVVKES